MIGLYPNAIRILQPDVENKEEDDAGSSSQTPVSTNESVSTIYEIAGNENLNNINGNLEVQNEKLINECEGFVLQHDEYEKTFENEYINPLQNLSHENKENSTGEYYEVNNQMLKKMCQVPTNVTLEQNTVEVKEFCEVPSEEVIANVSVIRYHSNHSENTRKERNFRPKKERDDIL